MGVGLLRLGALVAPCAWVMAFPAPREGEAENGVETEETANAGPAAALASDAPGHV